MLDYFLLALCESAITTRKGCDRIAPLLANEIAVFAIVADDVQDV